MIKCNFKLVMGCLLLALFFSTQHGFSQDFILDMNPAAVRDPRAAFVNPAIISRQGIPAVIGIRVLHMGIVDNSVALKHSYLGVSSDVPFLGLNFGANAQYFNYVKLVEARYSFLVSRPLIDILSMGLNFNILTRSYPDKSDLIDIEELPSVADFSIGAGLFLGPYQDFTVGLSLDHLNQPDITSDNSGCKQAITADFGLQYNYGFFSPSIYLHYSEGETSTFLSMEGNNDKLGMARLAFGGEKMIFEGQLNLLKKRMSIGYRLDFPLNELKSTSYGSHQISLVYRFIKPRSIEAYFDVKAKFDKLIITRKYVSIVANKGVTIDDIDALSRLKLNLFDEECRQKLMENARGITSGRDLESYSRIGLDKSYIRYKALLRQMVAKRRANLGRNDISIKIMAPPNTGERAIGLLGFIVDSLKIPSDSVNIIFTPNYNADKEKKYEEILEQLRARVVDTRKLMKRVEINVISDETLSPEVALFDVKRRIASAENVHSWRLVVKKDDEIVIIRAGAKDPEKIVWDWEDKKKNRIRHGKYTYFLQWKYKLMSSWKPENPDIHSFEVIEKPSSVTYYIGGEVVPSSKESLELYLKSEE